MMQRNRLGVLALTGERGEGTSTYFCRLPDMVHETKEQLTVRRAALMAVGRALRHELDCEQPDRLPDHIRRLLARLESKEEPKHKQ